MTAEERAELREQMINDFIHCHGPGIMAKLGREPDEHGDWSEEDIATMIAECTKLVDDLPIDINFADASARPPAKP